jgi:hypothetical protein
MAQESAMTVLFANLANNNTLTGTITLGSASRINSDAGTHDKVGCKQLSQALLHSQLAVVETTFYQFSNCNLDRETLTKDGGEH